MRPSSKLLTQLKSASLLRYRGKRSGKARNTCYINSSIAVFIRRRCVISLRPPRPQTRTLIPVVLSNDFKSPVGLRAQSFAAFSLLNAQSVKNKRFLIKDYLLITTSTFVL